MDRLGYWCSGSIGERGVVDRLGYYHIMCFPFLRQTKVAKMAIRETKIVIFDTRVGGIIMVQVS